MAKFPQPPTRTGFLRSGAQIGPGGSVSNKPNKQQTIWFDDIKTRFDSSPHLVGVPETSTSPGTKNEMALSDDGNTLYICIAQNTWRKVALSAF